MPSGPPLQGGEDGLPSTRYFFLCARRKWRTCDTFSLLFHNVNERPPHQRGKVENNGFEPLTPCLQSRCSSQLS